MDSRLRHDHEMITDFFPFLGDSVDSRPPSASRKSLLHRWFLGDSVDSRLQSEVAVGLVPVGFWGIVWTAGFAA